MLRCLRPATRDDPDTQSTQLQKVAASNEPTRSGPASTLHRSLTDPAPERRSASFPRLRRSKSHHLRTNNSFPHKSLTTPAQAHQAGQLGVTFSGAGFFLAYYMGIAQEFVRMGIIKDDTPVAGASAGALTAAIIKSKVPFHTIRESIHTMTNDVLQNGLMKRLGIALASNLEAYLPPDAHEHCSNGSVFLAITRALPYPKIKLYSKFDSRDDLKAALLASCHLPYLSNGDMTVPFRSKRCYDGGLLDLLPCPPGADYTITITAFPASEIHKLPGWMRNTQRHKLCLAPDMYGEWPYDLRASTRLALFPPSCEWLDSLWDKGAKDAVQYAVAAGLVKAADPLGMQPSDQGGAEAAGEGAQEMAAAGASAAGAKAAEGGPSGPGSSAGSSSDRAGAHAGAAAGTTAVLLPQGSDQLQQYRATEVPGEFSEPLDDAAAQQRPSADVIAQGVRELYGVN